jgi:hypothetical protein
VFLLSCASFRTKHFLFAAALVLLSSVALLARSFDPPPPSSIPKCTLLLQICNGFFHHLKRSNCHREHSYQLMCACLFFACFSLLFLLFFLLSYFLPRRMLLCVISAVVVFCFSSSFVVGCSADGADWALRRRPCRFVRQ